MSSVRWKSLANRYAGKCLACGEWTPENAGMLFVPPEGVDQRSKLYHPGCAPTAEWTDNYSAPTGPVAAIGTAKVLQAESQAETAEQAAARAKTLEEYFEADALAKHLTDAVNESVQSIADNVAAVFNAEVPAMIAAGIAQARPLAIQINKAPAVVIDRAHKALPDILVAVAAGASPFLVGPAGSGKTTLAEQIAKALGRSFYMASRVTSEYKLVGFTDANGKTVRTQFREAYEHGGLFLFDEVDASDPDALTAFNAALAGQLADFPDGMVRRHKDFAAIAAGNTFGRGADRQYVGRNQLDAATLDRFQTFEIDYDEQLEIQIAGNDSWTKYVQAVRHAIESEKVRHVVSPRASIVGAKLLAAGMERAKVEEACIWKGLDYAQRVRLIANGAFNKALAAHRELEAVS